jgi:mRNA-degrading endonuclease RelE of RelBE toxin-antitoxin system
MEPYYSKKFKKDYRSLPKDIQKLADKQLAHLFKNPGHPSLKTKKMQDPREIWEGRINYAYRFTFHWKRKICVLRRIGTHGVLKKP